MDEKEKQENQKMKEFLARKRSVTLTEDEWAALSAYILSNADSLREQINGWKERIKIKQPDGTPAFPQAATAVEFLESAAQTLDHIVRVISAPYLSSEEVEDLCGQ